LIHKRRKPWRVLASTTTTLVVALCLAPASAHAARRGPYLQNLQRDRITVCWETPSAQSGEVRLSDAAGNRIKSLSTTQPAARQEVVIDGLQPGSRYAYEVLVGDQHTLLGSGTFSSPPLPGQPFSFAISGDSRDGKKTAAVFSDLMLKAGVTTVIHTGDLVGDGRQLSQWDRDVFGPCGRLLANAVLWPAVGNHDRGSMPDSSQGVYETLFALPGQEIFYSFDYGDAHFLVLDSTRPLPEQAAFAEADLTATKAKWRFAVWHSPPFSCGGHPSDIRTRTEIVPILARHNVDMIVNGHNHHYVLSKPIRHAYEPNQRHGYVQLIAGGGGAPLAGIDSGSRWCDYAASTHHYVLVRVAGDRLEASAIDRSGRTFHRFMLDKASTAEAVAFELIELERYLTELSITNANLEGWPSGLLIQPGEHAGKMVYSVKNPLKEPVRFQVEFDCSAGLQFNPPRQDFELPAGEQKTLEAAFNVTAPEKLYPLNGPTVSFECGLGKGRVRTVKPPVALGREVAARNTDESITLDGRAKETIWSKIPEYGQFVRWSATDLAYQPTAQGTTVRAARNNQYLYLLMRWPVPAPASRPETQPDDVSLNVYVAGTDKALGIKVRPDGRHEFAGSRGVEKGVRVAQARQDGALWCEMEISLAAFGVEPGRGKSIAFNVMDTRGREIYTFAPTFRQHFSQSNSAKIVFE
jgi:acid phosphatase type 7